MEDYIPRKEAIIAVCNARLPDVSKDGIPIANGTPTIIPACEEVYDKYTDTAGNLHWTGTHSGKHIVKAEEGE